MNKVDQQLFDTITASWMDEEGFLLDARADKINELVKSGADTNTLVSETQNPIWHSAVGEPKLLEACINSGARNIQDLPFRDIESVQSLRLLIDNGYNPNTRINGESLLHYLWQMYDDCDGHGESRDCIVSLLGMGANIHDVFLCGVYRPYSPSLWMEQLIAAQSKEQQTTEDTRTSLMTTPDQT